MATELGTGVVRSLQESIDVRIETLQEVLVGQMNPLERRLALLERRQNLVFGRDAQLSASRPLDGETEQGTQTDERTQETPDVEPADRIEVEEDSPTDDAIRAANALAEKHTDAEAIVLSTDGTLEVREVSGGTFTAAVPEVLEREVEETRDAGTMTASTPSMRRAAAAKRGTQDMG